MRIILILQFFISIFSCKPENNSTTVFKVSMDTLAVDYTFPYNVEYTERIIILSNELKELSGLSFDASRNALWANNDEDGDMFLIHKESGQILDKIHFGKKGDYEGIECVNNVIYCIKSNGNLYKYDTISKLTQEIKTPLKTYNDVEGLGYDDNLLLIACKGIGGLDKKTNSKKEKSIYFFDLKTEQIITDSSINISDDSLLDWFKLHVESENYSKKKMDNFFRRVKDFSPSAIAKNPIDGTYYILSSVGKTLIVINRWGKIQYVYLLDDNTFAQPESICFEEDGTMYIGSEGKGFSAKIFVFRHKGLSSNDAK